MRKQWIIGLAAVLLVGASALSAFAQQCDDGLACTTNDMCSAGECNGTPRTGGDCDDGDDCTINDTCTAGVCRGVSAPVNTSCGGGCGTCQQIVPVPGVPTQCVGKAEDAGKSCDFGSGSINCFTGSCTIIPAAGNIAFCVPALKECPDTDGNPCTDNCNFQNGKCEKNASLCDSACAACNPNSGQCEPRNIGQACDDFLECSPQSRCGEDGFCEAGAPTGPTFTPTIPGSGPTPTATQPSSAACVGDCNGDKSVAVNELVTGVNIALGNAAVDTCPSFDTNDDGSVAVNELVGGVNSALNGCS